MKSNAYYELGDNKLQWLALDQQSIKYVLEARVQEQQDGIKRACILVTETGERIKLKVEKIILIS